jgi:hypothetical protein
MAKSFNIFADKLGNAGYIAEESVQLTLRRLPYENPAISPLPRTPWVSQHRRGRGRRNVGQHGCSCNIHG